MSGNHLETSDEERAVRLLWTTLFSPDGKSAECPSCGEQRLFHRVTDRRAYACDRCGAHVYPASVTPFAGSPLPLATWLAAVVMILERPSITPRQLAETLQVNYKTGWRMLKRVRADLDQGNERSALLWTLATAWSGSPHSPDDPTPAVDLPEDRIRAAACRVMADRGLPSTRIADIAREAGVSSAAVHYYFRSKDDVLLAAFRWAGEQLHASLHDLREDHVDPVEHVRRLLRVSVPSDQVLHDEYLLWLEVWARVRSHPHFLDECMKMSRLWYEAILEILGRGITDGVFHPVAPLEEICERYVAMSESLAYRSALGYRDMPPERARRVLARFTAEQLGLPVAILVT